MKSAPRKDKRGADPISDVLPFGGCGMMTIEIYFSKRAADISKVSVYHLTGLVHYAARDRNFLAVRVCDPAKKWAGQLLAIPPEY